MPFSHHLNLYNTLGLLGCFFVVVRPPLFWPWERSNCPSRSRNGPIGPKNLNFKKSNEPKAIKCISITLSWLEHVPMAKIRDLILHVTVRGVPSQMRRPPFEGTTHNGLNANYTVSAGEVAISQSKIQQELEKSRLQNSGK